MTNHPNRAASMHHSGLSADRATGEWDRRSTDDVHYDQHDGEVFAPEATHWVD